MHLYALKGLGYVNSHTHMPLPPGSPHAPPRHRYASNSPCVREPAQTHKHTAYALIQQSFNW